MTDENERRDEGTAVDEQENEGALPLNDEELEQVGGGFFCSLDGLCVLYECKSCGAHVRMEVGLGLIGLGFRPEKTCATCYGKTGCKTCKFYLGGIRCAK